MYKDLSKTDVWTAIITPLLETGHVDYPSLGKLLKKQEKANNGIVLLGSTGEALNLSETERNNILDFTLKANLKNKLIVGVGGINEEETLRWVEQLNHKKIDALLLVTPVYAKPGDKGQYFWFKKLMDNTKYPCMLYNVPSRSGISLSYEALEKLVDHPHFFAVKEASGSLDSFNRYKKICKGHPVYSGDDALTPLFIENGAAGVVSVASNVWIEETSRVVTKSKAKKLKKDEEKLWVEATEALFSASNPIPLKVLLNELGEIKSPLLKSPLTHLDMKEIEELKIYHKKIKEIF